MNDKPATRKLHFTDVAQHLTDAITSGHFAVNALLPTELELCEHYGTSRHTIRAALAQLQTVGLVLRKKNVGTRVIAATPRSSFRPSLSSVEDLVQFGAEHLRVLQRSDATVVRGALAVDIGCPDGTKWLRISSLRMVGNAQSSPIGWTDVYIDPRYEDIVTLARAAPGELISSLIESTHGRRIAEIHQDIRASLIDNEIIAKALGLPSNTPALRILRRYMDESGQLIQATVTVHPADRFSVSMTLKRAR